MKVIKSIIIAIITILLSGCWNYREIEKFGIAAGVAIEKGEGDKIHVTVETISTEGSDGEIRNNPIYTEFEGDTFFEAVRGLITINGQRLYWSHAKVAIVSENIAKEDVTRVLDFLKRDAEVRDDIFILVSHNEHAGKILELGKEEKEITSYKISDILKSQKSVSLFFAVETYEFLEYMANDKTSAILPAVKIIDQHGTPMVQVIGTAVFDRNKLAGYLNELESKNLLIIRNKMKRGLYTIEHAAEPGLNVALEIFECKTKVKPVVKDDTLTIDANIFIEANIGEITGSKNLIDEKGREKFKKIAEEQIKQNIKNLIKKAQKEYGLDFVNYKNIIKKNKPEVWRQIETDWETIFPEIETQVTVNLKIRGSATTKTPIDVGE